MTEEYETFLTTREAAKFLHVSRTTLYVWRKQKNVNLEFILLPGRILYRKSDLIAFMKHHTQKQGEH